jgi:hypothetical protein
MIGMAKRYHFMNLTTGAGCARPTVEEAFAVMRERVGPLDDWHIVAIEDGASAVQVASGNGPNLRGTWTRHQ